MYKSLPLDSFHLQTTRAITPITLNQIGKAYVVDKTNFSALSGITCYTLEVWDESMRLPHWHPNASELGYVVSGAIEIIIWRSPGESAVFTLTAGMCWFIPQAALHSLNNVGETPSQLLVGFSSEVPGDMDLPVAWNGIPVPLRNAYTSPHQELSKWQGVINNPLLGKYHTVSALNNVMTASPYGFDLAKVTPLFKEEKIGSVIWGVKSNWSILEDMSVLRAVLEPNVARDAIWYPDAGTLYIVEEGTAEFYIIIAGQDPTPFTVNQFDYIYVPAGVLHTFINQSTQRFTVVAFFTKADPQPEVSLSVSTAFFPNIIRKAAMTEFGLEKKSGDPLEYLSYKTVSPYLIPIKK